MVNQSDSLLTQLVNGLMSRLITCEDSLVLRACMGFTTRECSASNKQYV